MSFVTKRERVFSDDVELYELPPRNECKIKAYASCTDARAWSHFYSDQNEHLVDIIKRNNTSCAPKYVPTKVIVDTIMSQKNCEISRLRRKIDTLDQMLAVYDQLELDCGQKCEIAKAHESIKAASKDLDEVCLDLDISGFTEGFVESSDVYETGKSRGDEMEKSKGDMSVYSRVTSTEPNTKTKGVQKTPACSDAATVARDSRIDKLQEEIIFKDAKLNAMQNSMAVLENDVCEPYCVYAHIYTALEKIYGILYQNDTYRQYLELLSVGKDTRCLDIKGKILFKMKILEKFALALMAPCSTKFAAEAEKENAECACGNTKIVARVETTYALTASESEPPPTSDNKRAHLVAEIMDSDEMKEILERDLISDELDTGNAYCGLTCYSIDAENVKRLQDLQNSYDELMECFENLKHDRDCLQVRCRKYNELELEVETLRDQLNSCNALWNEKERFRKRLAELEDIYEKYLLLQNVTGNLESELKAEKEINNNKMQLIEDLRSENLILERKLSDATIAFEREKSALLCKLKELECALTCKDKQIESLSDQIQKHFDGSQDRERESIKTFSLLNDIESLKAELMNAKGLLNCCEEEKEHIKEEFQDKLSLINDLRMEIEDWKGECENLMAEKSYMKKEFESDIADLEDKNDKLTKEMDSKARAIGNLMEMLSEKSKEINTLLEDIENKKQENEQLMSEVLDLRNEHSTFKEQYETEKCELQELLESERKKSKELENALNRDSPQEILQNENIQRTSDTHPRDYDSLRALLEELSTENRLIRERLNKGECCQVDFKKENERLNVIIKSLQNDKRNCEISQNLLNEELHNWKQKFEYLKKDNINKTQNLDSMVAELDNWKYKCRLIGVEKYDYASDNYEEADSNPEKHNSSNSKIKHMPKDFVKSASQIQRAEVEENLWKQHFSGSREHARSSLDNNTLGHVTEHRERVSLHSATEKTTHRFSDPNQMPLYNVNDKALRSDSEPQTQAEFISDDRKTTPSAFDAKTKEKCLELSASRRHSADIRNDFTPLEQARPSTANEKDSYQDSHLKEQKFEDVMHQERSLDDKAFSGDIEPQKRQKILSPNNRAMQRDTDPQNQKLLQHISEQSLLRDPEYKTRNLLLNAAEISPSLDFGVKGKSLDSDPSVSRHDIEFLEKSQIDNTLTSHDLRPLERARFSADDEKVIHEARYQEKDQTNLLSSENENTKCFTNHRSDIEGNSRQHKEDLDNFNQHDRQPNHDNQDIIRLNKFDTQTQQRESINENHDEKLSFDEKSDKDAGPWMIERDSDYSSKRPSFGKTEAEKSLKRQRRFTDTQYKIFDETDQQKSEYESKLRQKRHTEEHTDWKQKYDESKGEKILLSLQEKDIELNHWKEKYINLEKGTHDEQANIKNKLDEVVQEKNQLEQKLRDKINELDVEKHKNQLNLEKVREINSIEEKLQKKKQFYENALEEKCSLQKQLDDTNKKMAALLQSLEQDKSQLFTLSKRIPNLEGKLQEYQNTIDEALAARESLQNQLIFKTDELSEKLAENNALNEKLLELRFKQSTSDENLVTLQNQKDELQILLQDLKKEHSKLLRESDDLRSLLEDLDGIKNDYDDKEKENKSLIYKLNQMEMQFTVLEKKNNDNISALANALAHNNELETLLMEAREEMARRIESPELSFYQTVKDEVTALKRDMYEKHAEIRELKDQQDANENLISELSSNLMARDERISILENHINLLQDEIQKLHKNLDDGVTASEQLQGQAFEGYDESIKKIEAHHSKAFHNMKMEISQLEKEKSDLREQLSKSRNENENSLRDKNAYLSKIADLTNEREEMLKDLRKLELLATGKSNIVTDNDSYIQSVKESFSRISNNLEANRSQSAALESKLHIVKKSSEELFSKTNEAKKIAENEKQKVLLEKEEAVRGRLNLENQMKDLKVIFEKQHDEDAAIIEDLRKEILNQILLMQAIKECTQKYEEKLKDELAIMENQYKNSLMEIDELRNKLNDSNRENDAYQDTIKAKSYTIMTQTKKLNETIEKYNEILQNNHKEMSELQEALNDLRSISKVDAQTQSDTETQNRETQSQKEFNAVSENQSSQTNFLEKKSRVQERIQAVHRKQSESITQFAENMTELQIMNANVQPTLDFVKTTYTKYKQGQLSPVPVEQHSILSLVEPSIKKDNDNQLIDIFSRRSLAIEYSQYEKTNNTDQSLNTNTVGNININSKNLSSSGQSNDEDVFVIYTSSENVHNEQLPISITESSTPNRLKKNKENNLTLTNKTDLEKGIDDSANKIFSNEVIKPRERKVTQHEQKLDKDAKIKISASDEGFALPKKHNPNITRIGNIENAGKSSESSYNGDISQQMLLHNSDTDDDKLKRKETQSKSNLSLNETKLDSEDLFDNLSNDQDNHFKLGRIDRKIESGIFKDKDVKIALEPSEKQDLGLNFILETAKHETQETFDYNTNLLRRSQSAESFSKNSSQTGHEKSYSTHRQQIVSHSIVMPVKNKEVADKGVSLNIEPSNTAAKKIEQLTAALDNSEKDYKKKLESIKAQYDANIKRMINDHNEGVKNLQNLHEDMVKDLVKKHDSEVKNLRSISFESMKRAEQMEKENKLLKSKLVFNGNDILDQFQEPVKIDSGSRVRDARLSKTTVESLDVKPRTRHAGPCTCSLDINVSDTIRNIFDQVDQDQRKLAEFTYVKYIAHKMLSGNVDALDSQELAFLHYNVCRHWKVKQNIEDTLRKKIDSLETELISKQRHAQQHIAELDRRVAEERRRLQEVREAVGYQPAPGVSHDMQPDRDSSDLGFIFTPGPHPPRNMDAPCSPIRVKKIRPESHGSERRCQRPQQSQNNPDEMPTRLRRCQDRPSRSYRK